MRTKPGAVASAAREPGRGSAAGLTPDGKPVVVQVPYGEHMLAGPRIEALRADPHAVSRIGTTTGIVEVRTYPGRFCLVGNATEGYSVAPDELAFSRCNSVGNPHEDTLELPAARVARATPTSSASSERDERRAGRAPDSGRCGDHRGGLSAGGVDSDRRRVEPGGRCEQSGGNTFAVIVDDSFNPPWWLKNAHVQSSLVSLPVRRKFVERRAAALHRGDHGASARLR